VVLYKHVICYLPCYTLQSPDQIIHHTPRNLFPTRFIIWKLVLVTITSEICAPPTHLSVRLSVTKATSVRNLRCVLHWFPILKYTIYRLMEVYCQERYISDVIVTRTSFQIINRVGKRFLGVWWMIWSGDCNV
jgi:hypothetical protein